MLPDNIVMFFIITSPLAMPAFIGIAMLIGFRKDKLGLLAGLFTLKPVIAYPILFFFLTKVSGNPYLLFVTAILPSAILTASIIYIFRTLFIFERNYWVVWLLSIFDILQWLNLFLLPMLAKQFTFLDDFAWTIFANPTLYAFAALFLVASRFRGGIPDGTNNKGKSG